MNEDRFKSIVYREIGSLMAALSEPRRLAILDLLAQRKPLPLLLGFAHCAQALGVRLARCRARRLPSPASR